MEIENLSMNLSASEINEYFFDKNPTPMLIFERATLGILKVNEAAAEKYGHSLEEFEDMNVKDIHAKEEVPVVLKHLEGIDKEFQSPYFRHQKKNGDVFYAQVSSRNFSWQDIQVQLAVIHDVSKQVEAQQRAEEAQREALEERKFSQLLIKNLADAFWLMDKDGNVVDWNEYLEEVSGFSGEEIRNRYIMDFFAEEERSHLEVVLAAAFAEGKATAEGTLITKDGREIPHALTGVKFTYHDEPYIAGIAINIKAQKDYQKELEKAKNTLDRAQKIAQLGSWEMSFDDMVPHWSAQMYEILGVSKENVDLSFEKLLTFLPAEEGPELRKYIEDAMTGVLDGKEFEHRIITTEGETRHVVERGELDYDDEGNSVKMSGTMQDITERKKIENDLSQRSKAIEASMDGVAIVNSDSQLIYMNEATVSIFGYESPAELIGEKWSKLYRKKHIDILKKEAFTELELNGEWRGETVGKRKDGSLFHQEVSLSGVEGGGLICICRDISERKETENHIQESLEEKKVLLAEIHHRVKNNLAIISGLLELEAMNWEENVEVKNVMRQSQLRVQSMAKIHEKLYESGDFSNLKLEKYVAELVDNIHKSMNTGNKNIKLNVESDDIKLNINQAIPCALIINELVTNAFKYAFEDEKEGELYVALKSKGDTITVAVEDSGPGLPDSFEETSKKSLGHRLVKQLVKQLHAEMTVKSNEDIGTRFKIIFQKEDKSGSAGTRRFANQKQR
jgi:PAS domain S-box-containing protein